MGIGSWKKATSVLPGVCMVAMPGEVLPGVCRVAMPGEVKPKLSKRPLILVTTKYEEYELSQYYSYILVCQISFKHII